jgi:hypothetical protein
LLNAGRGGRFFCPTQHQQGEIVRSAGVLTKRGERAQTAGQQLFGRCSDQVSERVHQPRQAELCARRIPRFHQAVAVQKQAFPGVQLNPPGNELSPWEHPQRDVGGIDPFDLTTAHDQRGPMAGVVQFDFARASGATAHQRGVLAGERAIHFREQLGEGRIIRWGLQGCLQPTLPLEQLLAQEVDFWRGQHFLLRVCKARVLP